MAFVLAIVNQKGGVGKTTTAVNLGSALAGLGRRVLVADCDPQSNATRSLGVHKDPPVTVYDGLMGGGRGLSGAILAGQNGRDLDLLPAAPGLAGAEVELVAMSNREGRLDEALASLKEGYDYVLLDCPPSLGLLSVNALVAADGVIVPVQCEYLSLEGLGLLTRTLRLVKAHLNPRLELTGVVLTMFDGRTKLAAQVVTEVSKHFPGQRFANVIPRSVRLSEAPSYGETIDVYSPGSPGAVAYSGLAEELIERVEGGAADGSGQPGVGQ